MINSSFTFSKFQIPDIEQNLNSDVELFICAASFEDRCLSIPLSLEPQLVKHVLVLKNDDVAGAGSRNAARLAGHFGSNASLVEITKTIAIKTADRIAREVRRRAKVNPENIYVDITCMTHETLLILYSLLTHIFQDNAKKIRYLYSPAAEYDPGVEYKKKWLSRGIKDVRSILGYPGRLLPSRKNRLLVLVGFEVKRASALIEVYEPASLGLGYGDGTLNEQHKIINQQRHKQLSDSYPNAGVFEFSPSDPDQVKHAILEDAKIHSDLNLIVAPMNSKVSTIGAALAAQVRPEIQLCYAPAVTYNFENYSLAGNDAVLFFEEG